jgi:hypothetical protein
MKINDRFIIPFKGERKYIHSTDIFNAIRSILDYGVEIDFQLNSNITHPITLIYVSERELLELRFQENFCGKIAYNDVLGKRSFLAILQNVDEKIDIRIPYDELEIIKGYEIIGKSIRHKRIDSDHTIERIVALNKQLLNAKVKKKPWVFTRIELIDLHFNSNLLILEIDPISNSRICKTNILISDGIVGNIYFV